MKRFFSWFAAFGLALGLIAGQCAAAPKPPEEGFDYRVLKPAQPVEKPGSIEVIEFFWYGCPHCFDLEAELSAWGKRQGKDVHFRRVPIAFDEARTAHSRIFYTLEALGKLEALHQRVLNAYHVDRKRLLDENEIADFMAQNGIARDQWLAAYRSFTTVSKVNVANRMAAAYQIDGVPTLVVQGKYVTSPSIAGGSKARTFEVLDWLVDGVRKKRL